MVRRWLSPAFLALTVLALAALLSGGPALAQDATVDTVNLSVSPSTLAEDAGRTTVTVTATFGGRAGAPVRGINLSVWIHRKDQTFTSVFAGADDFTATDIPDINIPAGQHSASVTFTLTPVDDGDDTEDTEQIVIKGETVIRYDGYGHITRAEVRMYLANPYVPPPPTYMPRLPQPTVSLDGDTTRTTRAVSRPGRFDLYIIPDRQTVRDREEWGESQAYKDYHASLRYRWKQVSGPRAGPPPPAGTSWRLYGNGVCASGGPGTYCTYYLSHPDEVMSFDVWDGVTRPTEWQAYGSYFEGIPNKNVPRDDPTPPNPPTPPGEYVFEFTITERHNGNVVLYPAPGDPPQRVTVNVADETKEASAPTAIAKVTTTSPHPQETYTITDRGRGPDGVYRTTDDTGEAGDPGPDEIIGTDDDVVLIVGPDGQPCTDDDTLACGVDGLPGTDDDGLNLGPDGRAGTADDNTTIVQPDTRLQTPNRRVTLSGRDSAASSGRSIASYSWRQICLNPDAYGYHKVVAYHDLVKGIGYCGVDTALSSDSGRTVSLTTPSLPAMVKRASMEPINPPPLGHECFRSYDCHEYGYSLSNERVETTTEEDTVSLFYMMTVTDSEGGQDYDLVRVNVESLPEVVRDTSPIAKATATYTGSRTLKPALEGATVTLSASGSRAREGRIASYRWTQTSGPTVELSSDTSSRATFTTPTGQIRDMAYAFRLTVTDTVGSQDFAVVKIGVRARPTVAVDFTRSNAQGVTWNEGDVIGLRGTIGGLDGETLTYTWSSVSVPASVNNAAWSETTGTASGPSARVTTNFMLPCLAAETLHTFTLSVTDGVTTKPGTALRTLRVNANPDGCTSPGEPPVLPPVEQVLTVTTADAGPDLAGQPGDSVTLQGTNSYNPYGEWWEMAHQWAQLSGPTVTLTHPLTTQPAANFGDPRFVIPADAADGATLEFQLTVTDKEGQSDSDTMTVTVDAPSPATGQSAGPRITIERMGISSIVREGGTAEFEIIPGEVVEDITVTLEITVEGDFGVSAGQQTVLLKAREGELDIAFATHDDDVGEANGTLTVRVVSGDGYRVGSPSSATFTITDNDGGPPLTGVSLDGIPLEFTPGRTEYLAQVANEIEQTAVRTTEGASVQIAVNGGPVQPGEAIPLAVGGNVITIATSSGGVTDAIYTITVTRAAAPSEPDAPDAEPSSNRWTITLSPASGTRPAEGQTAVDVQVNIECNGSSRPNERICPFARGSVTFQVQADGSEPGEATHRTDFGGPRKAFVYERDAYEYVIRINIRPGSGDAEYVPFVLMENGVAMAEGRFLITP